MKRGVIIAIAVVLVGAVGLGFWSVLESRRNPIEYHKRGWFEARNRIARAKSARTVPRTRSWERLMHWLDRSVSDDQIMQRHEAALFALGYLTNHDFFVTNQILTLEFSSNFFQRIYQRFGTNERATWACRYMDVSHRYGFHATLPAKDVTEWETLFRECAARYASNVPPSL